MTLTKMQCLGGDYLFVNCMNDDVKDPKSLAIKVCDRHFGLGADGLVLYSYSNDADYKLECYSPDGIMMGCNHNILICSVKYASYFGLLERSTISIDTLETNVKYVSLLDDYKVTVNLGQPVVTPQLIPVDYTGDNFVDKTISVANEEYQATCLSINGKPCTVIYTQNGEELNDVKMYQIAPLIENHNIFPTGTSVIFANVVERDLIQSRCWNQGENENVGSIYGAAASFVASVLNGYVDKKCKVELHGGDLELELSEDEFVYATSISEKVYEINWNL